MATLTVVVGLPASGKTHRSNKIASDRKIGVFHDVLGRHHIPSDKEGFCSLLKALQSGKDCVANEICLCHEDKRSTFKHMLHILFENTVVVEWIFFENDPDQCIKNASADTKKIGTESRIKSIKEYSIAYTIPDGFKPEPVHKPKP